MSGTVEVLEQRNRLLAASLREFLALRQAVIDLGGADGPLDSEMIRRLAEMQAGVVARAKAALSEAVVGRGGVDESDASERIATRLFKCIGPENLPPADKEQWVKFAAEIIAQELEK